MVPVVEMTVVRNLKWTMLQDQGSDAWGQASFYKKETASTL